MSREAGNVPSVPGFTPQGWSVTPPPDAVGSVILTFTDTAQ
jgi:hypothetical protein